MTVDRTTCRYLLVTHIPFAREAPGQVSVDALWARDLEGLVASVGPVTVAAPDLSDEGGLPTWGPGAARLDSASGIRFASLRPVQRWRERIRWPQNRRVLAREVSSADIVHTHNLFPPYLGLSFAHDLAVKLGKQTVFVIAEDFHDMLEWEWVRTAPSPRERRRRSRTLSRIDARVRRTAGSASLTFLHTPAAVARYRCHVHDSMEIRQPGHERDDVISAGALEEKESRARAGSPLAIVAACRHKPLKGLDFLIRATARLAARGVPVEVRLYGEGEQTPELRQLAHRLGVADRVDFPGPLAPGREVYDAVAAGDLFAMPHRTNDFGRAFYDGLVGGSPIIAFRTPASEETVRHGVDGLLAPLDDVEGLAQTIERYHEDRGFLAWSARQARERALRETRSDWFRIRAERTLDLLPASSREATEHLTATEA